MKTACCVFVTLAMLLASNLGAGDIPVMWAFRSAQASRFRTHLALTDTWALLKCHRQARLTGCDATARGA